MSRIFWNTTGVTYAGTGIGGSALNQLSTPNGLFFNSNDTLYISDNGNYRVVSYLRNAVSGSLVAGTGLNGNALNQLGSAVRFLYVDTNGSIYIADSTNHRVVRWTSSNSTGVIVAGNGISGASLSQLNVPYGVWVDSNSNVFVTEHNNHRVTRWAPSASTGVVVAGVTGLSGESDNRKIHLLSYKFDYTVKPL